MLILERDGRLVYRHQNSRLLRWLDRLRRWL